MLSDKVLDGDVRAAARMIRRLDDGDREVIPDLRRLYPYAGRAHIIGFTGSPGVGKSTLVDRIVARFREDGRTVGILLVDPSSPFTGGAILGDRVRMQRHSVDEGVFIRSLATRGAFGGLTRSTSDAIVVLEAMGKDVVIVETVGVGQDEVEIVHSAHTTAVVTVPGMGDDIQAIKAGLMEIGDLFVVNKSDRDGAAKTVREISFMLDLNSDRHEAAGWRPEIVQTVAIDKGGIEELYQGLRRHRSHLVDGDGEKLQRLNARRLRNQLVDLLKEQLMLVAIEKIGGAESLNALVREMVEDKKDPYGACLELVDKVLGGARF